MGQSLFNGPEQIRPGTLTRALLNTATAGSAVIAKLILGVGLVMSNTGVDSGTGDVTLSVLANPPCGRLTLASATPVMVAAVSAATSVFYTPYLTSGFPQWNGSVFLDGLFTEASQALSDATKSPAAAVASMGYDVFGWYDGATFRATRGPAWTAGATAGTWAQAGGTCTRGAGAGSTALVSTQGVLVNQFAITNGPAAGYGVFLGTIATDSSGATVSWSTGSSAAGGGKATLNVWNMYNRVKFCANVRDSNASHTYKTASYQAFDASGSNAVTFVRGIDEDQVAAQFVTRVAAGQATASNSSIGIGLDNPTALSSLATQGYAVLPALSGAGETISSTFAGSPGLGAHTLTALELGDGTNANTFYGYPFAALTAELVQ